MEFTGKLFHAGRNITRRKKIFAQGIYAKKIVHENLPRNENGFYFFYFIRIYAKLFEINCVMKLQAPFNVTNNKVTQNNEKELK